MPRPSTQSTGPTQVFETRRENTHASPPSSQVPIVVRDCGSAGPRHMRFTLNSIPQSADLLKSSAIPLVVLTTPLAVSEPGDTSIPVIDPGPSGPLRCSHCKAYVCPYMRWEEGGRKMVCCFCGRSTEVPPDNFSHLSLDGVRRDRDQRPELYLGAVEYLVGGEYQVRPPVPPTYLFLIETTSGAVQSGATSAACSCVAACLEDLPGGGNARVCIVTFDSTVHFYSFTTSQSGSQSASQLETIGQPKMMVVSDVNDPFCPLADAAVALTLSTPAHIQAVRTLLESIPQRFAESHAGESAAGPALAASIQALKAGVGGRLVAFLASLPHSGVLALRPREAGRPPSEKDTLDVMLPATPAVATSTLGLAKNTILQKDAKRNLSSLTSYAGLAAEAAEFHVSVDIFAMSQGYVDLATLSVLTSETCGSLHRYTPFRPAADMNRLYDDLRWCLVRPYGMEAVGRVRVSQGLTVESYSGSFHRRNPTDLHFPAISCEHTIAAKIVHEERLREGSEAYIQFALLYTSTDGRRRLRSLTVALPVTRSLGAIFRAADLDSYVTYVSRKVSVQLCGRSIAACRDVIIKAAVDTLVAYRKHVATASSSGQLILPESLKLLPLFALGMTKLPCFRTDSRADSRAVWISRLLSAPPYRVMPALHPRFMQISYDPVSETQQKTELLPDRLWLTAEKLQPEGIFLLENGYDAYLYIGPAVREDVCTALLGVARPEAVDESQWNGLPVLDTPMNRHLHKVLHELRSERRSYMHLRLMRRGHPQEAGFLASLIEDRSPSAGMSYVEFLCLLHRQIQNKLT